MINLASEQFHLAYSTPLGKADFVVIYYRGYLAKQQLKLETAFEMAELALNLSDQGSEENAQAQQLLMTTQKASSIMLLFHLQLKKPTSRVEYT